MKLLVIGFDGLSPDLAREALDPIGYHVNPMLCPVPLTGPSWWTIYTGLSQEQHGIKHMHALTELHPEKLRTLCRQAWWAQAACQGQAVFCWNLPSVWPAPQLPNGQFYCGWPFFVSDYSSWPEDPDWPSAEADPCWWEQTNAHFSNTDYAVAVRSLGPAEAIAREHLNLSLCMESLEFSGFDIAFVQFPFVDHLGHMWNMATERDGIVEAVREITRTLQDCADEVAIVSDHGFNFPNQEHEDYGTWATRKSTWEITVNVNAAACIRSLAGIKDEPADVLVPDVDPPDPSVVESRLQALGYIE